jgi:hypothetical protein
LAIVNSTAINMGVQVSLECKVCHIPLGISLGVGLLDHMAYLGLVFKEASILLSKVVLLAYIPTSSV